MVSLFELIIVCFFFYDTATNGIVTYCHTLSLHDALPISQWFREVEGEFARTKTGDFFGCRADLRPFEGLAPVDAFCEWLDLPTTASATEEGLLRLLRGTGLEYDTESRGHTAEMFGQERSEEHTSELQSLMRNSYAVFCWTKKNRAQKHK